MSATGYVSPTGDTRKVNKAGDTMTGELTLPDSSPDQALNAAPKGYVDTGLAAKAALAHAAQHAAAGSDPLTLTQAQITGLVTALAALAPLDGATFTGAVTVDGAGITILDGQLVLDSSGTAINAVDRGATSNFAAYVLRTGGVDRWSWQMINDATNDLLLTDSANGVNIIRVVPHPTTPTTTISGVAAAGSKNGLTGIRLVGHAATTGAPTTGTWAAGDSVQDSAGTWWLCTVGGSPGTWTSPATTDTVPADAGLITWSYPPWAASSAGPGASGTIYYMRAKVPTAQTVTGVRLYQTAPGATLTAGQCLVGLYDSSGTRVAAGADQSTAWASGSQVNKNADFTSPYAAAAGYYWVALLFVGTTGPSWSKGPPSGLMNAGWPSAPFPALVSGSGQTSLPGSVTLSSLSTTVSAFWAALY